MSMSVCLSICPSVCLSTSGVLTRRAVSHCGPWRAIWWSSSLTPPRFPCLELDPTWPGPPQSSKGPMVCPSSPNCASSAPSPTRSTPPPKAWRVEVSSTEHPRAFRRAHSSSDSMTRPFWTKLTDRMEAGATLGVII